MDINFQQKYQYTDEKLCTLALAGDRQAEEILVQRYSREVRICARPFFLAGGDSEDLIQEAMFGLLKAIREFDIQRDVSFHTFAIVCIRNRIRTAVTMASRDKHAPLNNSVPFEQPMLGSESDPEEQFISKEAEEERLSELNRQLSDFEQKILSLFLCGLSYHEISRQIGRPVKSVDNAVQRIRRKVANFYGDFSES